MISSIYDTIIVGAGAAGIAAGRVLHDAGYKVHILEARNRIGGRIHTDYTFADFPIELGAEFIHGDNAVTHELVKQAGLSTIPVDRMGKLWWADWEPLSAAWGSGNPYAPRWTRQYPEIEALLTAYNALAQADLPEDISLYDYLRQTSGLGRFDWADWMIADVLLAQTCCAPIKDLSCYDLIREMRADHAGHGEARIREGYGALLEWYTQNLPIQLESPVSKIQYDAAGVSVYSKESIFKARSCVVTLPVSLLQQETIQFAPTLSARKLQAIRSLRMEPATKLIFRHNDPTWHDDVAYIASANPVVGRWWTPGHGRGDTPVITKFVTSDLARKVDSLAGVSEKSLIRQELYHLHGMMGSPDEKSLSAFKRVSWAEEPYTRGGYAYVPVGQAQARVDLAQPEGDKLFFAGEATAYDSNPQTVHGAIESGWRAAKEAMAVL